jgi:hypothetical protein
LLAADSAAAFNVSIAASMSAKPSAKAVSTAESIASE